MFFTQNLWERGLGHRIDAVLNCASSQCWFYDINGGVCSDVGSLGAGQNVFCGGLAAVPVTQRYEWVFKWVFSRLIILEKERVLL